MILQAGWFGLAKDNVKGNNPTKKHPHVTDEELEDALLDVVNHLNKDGNVRVPGNCVHQYPEIKAYVS